MKCFLIGLAFLLTFQPGKSQILRDSFLLVVVFSHDSIRNGNTFYTIKTFNRSDSPVCILYSIRSLLSSWDETKLGAWKSSDSTEEFYLGYAAGERVHDHWIPEFANNPLVIPPIQTIDFRIAVPVSRKKQYLNFDYVVAPDLCLVQMRKEYYAGNDWSKRYKRYKKRVQLKVIWNK